MFCCTYCQTILVSGSLVWFASHDNVVCESHGTRPSWRGHYSTNFKYIKKKRTNITSVVLIAELRLLDLLAYTFSSLALAVAGVF